MIQNAKKGLSLIVVLQMHSDSNGEIEESVPNFNRNSGDWLFSELKKTWNKNMWKKYMSESNSLIYSRIIQEKKQTDWKILLKKQRKYLLAHSAMSFFLKKLHKVLIFILKESCRFFFFLSFVSTNPIFNLLHS